MVGCMHGEIKGWMDACMDKMQEQCRVSVMDAHQEKSTRRADLSWCASMTDLLHCSSIDCVNAWMLRLLWHIGSLRQPLPATMCFLTSLRQRAHCCWQWLPQSPDVPKKPEPPSSSSYPSKHGSETASALSQDTVGKEACCSTA